MTDLKAVKAIKSTKPMRFVDIIVIILVVAISIVITVIGMLNTKKGDIVVITVDGKASKYSLSSNRSIVLDCLTVVIESGYVYIIDSCCQDKICEHTGKISKVNQSIVCLPNNIVITILGNSEFQADTGQTK